MKESIGATASLNIALAFIAIIFAFLAGALSYYKSFKVNNIIKNSIEKYEGINNLSKLDIDNKLSSLGYQRYEIKCNDNEKFGNVSYSKLDSYKDNGKGLCVYYSINETKKTYKYGIVTYMTINIPIVSDFLRIPIKTTTDDIYGCYGGVDSFKIGSFEVSCKQLLGM